MKTTFETTIRGFGNNTGIEVPSENISELGVSKKPPVIVTIAGYSYKSTVAVMKGMFLISLSKAHREAANLSAGDKISVVLTLDDGPREVVIPEELRARLKHENLTEKFSNLAYSKRKEFCRQVSEAKAEETKIRRLDKIAQLVKAD
ncbi:MAG: YdeI/OmpD-associated family protein [bacterium]|nr:YdeI/OmpD-associated family protein [bacterium]MDQ3159069.1 YdeI/OmpD-associated family protein [bacterium]